MGTPQTANKVGEIIIAEKIPEVAELIADASYGGGYDEARKRAYEYSPNSQYIFQTGEGDYAQFWYHDPRLSNETEGFSLRSKLQMLKKRLMRSIGY